MSSYLQRLTAASSEMPAVDSRILLLTGQSSFTSSALSPEQILFLETVSPPECTIVRTGFPFDASFDGSGFRNVATASASWRNARQVSWALFSRRFRAAVARRLQLAMDATSRRLILITGSCGLQLANAAWPLLHVPAKLRLDIVALGPACLGTLRVPAAIVQGRRDGWSRLFYAGRVDRLCAGGHLDYWESAEARALVRGLLQ